jgi:hypothetical protein
VDALPCPLTAATSYTAGDSEHVTLNAATFDRYDTARRLNPMAISPQRRRLDCCSWGAGNGHE